MAVPNIVSSNLTVLLSDHLLHFFFNFSYFKSKKYERDWPRFDQENFVRDSFSVCWDKVLLASNMNMYILTMQNFSL